MVYGVVQIVEVNSAPLEEESSSSDVHVLIGEGHNYEFGSDCYTCNSCRS